MKFYWTILSKVSVGVTRSDWPVRPSEVTKKNGERDGGEDGLVGGIERGTLRRNKMTRFALVNEILQTARAAVLASPTKQQTSFLTPVLF